MAAASAAARNPRNNLQLICGAGARNKTAALLTLKHQRARGSKAQRQHRGSEISSNVPRSRCGIKLALWHSKRGLPAATALAQAASRRWRHHRRGIAAAASTALSAAWRKAQIKRNENS